MFVYLKECLQCQLSEFKKMSLLSIFLIDLRNVCFFKLCSEFQTMFRLFKKCSCFLKCLCFQMLLKFRKRFLFFKNCWQIQKCSHFLFCSKLQKNCSCFSKKIHRLKNVKIPTECLSFHEMFKFLYIFKCSHFKNTYSHFFQKMNHVQFFEK